MDMTTPPTQPAPKPAPPRHRVIIGAVLAGVVLLVCGLCGITAVIGSGSDDDPATAATASERAGAGSTPDRDRPTKAPPPVADSAGTVSGFCDMILFTGPNRESEFAASVDVENTGNVGIEVEVTVEFDQLGTDDFRFTDRVEVEVGETVTVEFSEHIGSDTVSRHQRGGYDCRIDGEIVGEFGEVQ